MSSCHSQTHSLGKVMVTEVVEASGPSDVYCGLGPLGAGMAMVVGILKGCLVDGFTCGCPGPLTLCSGPLQPG